MDMVSIDELANRLEIHIYTLKKRLDLIDHPIVDNCISKEAFDAFLKQRDEYLSIIEIFSDYYQELKGAKITGRTLDIAILHAEGNHFWNVPYITNPIFKENFGFDIDYYVMKTDVDLIKHNIREYFFLKGEDAITKLKFLVEETTLSRFPKTTKYLQEFFDKQSAKKQKCFTEVANYFRYVLQKDLTLYTNDDISVFMTNADKDLSGLAKSLLIDFYDYLKTKESCQSNMVINYNRHKGEPTQTTIFPYDEETYLKVAFMVFNESYWTEHNMIKQAISNKTYAQIWIYHIMLFICAWRKCDIISKLPRLKLDESPADVLMKISKGEYLAQNYIKTAEILSYRFYYNGNHAEKLPSKTSQLKNTPYLKLHIPESFKSVFGMLILMCEAHQQIENSNKPLCYIKSVEINDCVQFFGQEYSDVLDEKVFLSRRAIKNYMNNISDTGEKIGVDGYFMASFARSHTGGINTIPEVTSRYLKAKMDGYSPNEIVRCLMERGVCSFVPYMLCSALDRDNFEQKRLAEQTNDMSSLLVSPAQIENLLKLDEELATLSKAKIQEVLKMANVDSIDVFAQLVLGNIVSGNCYGKTEGTYCLAKACNIPCVYKQRVSCVGCGYEMYIKSIFMELSLEITKQEKAVANANTDGERLKRNNILKNRLYPAAQECLKTIKKVYNTDVGDYIKILERSGEYAFFSEL